MMKNKSTELVFILDESGSMYNLKGDTIGGFNSMIEQQKQIKQTCYVTTVLFNTTRKVIHDRERLENIKLMTNNDYMPGGCTALLDTIGDTIQHISTIHKYIRRSDVPNKTLFVIMTDGYENASHLYNDKMIHDLISEKKKTGWEFMFIGANIDAEYTAKSYGIDKEMAVNYHADAKGSEVVYGAVNEAVKNLRQTQKMKSNWKENIEKDYRSRK